MPRHRVALGADRAASRPRGALRVRLSHPAEGGHRSARRAAGTRVDFCDLHAWAEIYLPGAGWIGFDATSGLLTAEGHIPLVAALHFQAAAPITGTVEPAETEFSFEMSVARA